LKQDLAFNLDMMNQDQKRKSFVKIWRTPQSRSFAI